MTRCLTRAIQQLTFIGAPFSCLRLPGDELEGEESYAPGLHDLVVSEEREQESETLVLVTVAAEPVLEESVAPATPDQGEQKTTKRGRGRPRKGGADAALRKGLVLPLSVVDNSPFSPIRLTVPSDSPYDQEALYVSHFKQRG